MEYAHAKRLLLRVQIDTSEIDVVNASSSSSSHHKPEVKNGRASWPPGKEQLRYGT